MPNRSENSGEIIVMRNHGFDAGEETVQLSEISNLGTGEHSESNGAQRAAENSQNGGTSGDSLGEHPGGPGGVRLRELWSKCVETVRECLVQLEYNSRVQLPLIKFVLRVFIILSLTILPLINEIHTVTPLLSAFLGDNDWFLVPMSMNKQIINNDLLLRLNKHEYNILLQRRHHQHKISDEDSLFSEAMSLNHHGLFLQNSISKKLKNNYSSHVCTNRDSRLLMSREVNLNNEHISLLVPSVWCPIAGSSNELNHMVYNTRREGPARKVRILYFNRDENARNKILDFTSFRMHKNTYRYRPTGLFKIISTLFVIIRWCMLISRMVMQLWNFNTFFSETEGSNSSGNNAAQFQFVQEFKSLVSFSIFYIWSLSCVYLLFGLTTSKCSNFPKIAIHEKVQWLLWVCILITTVCFYLARLPYFDHSDDQSSPSNSSPMGTSSNPTSSSVETEAEENYLSRKRKIFIQHILSVISCCGFGFSLSGSVLLLSTRITSPWVNSCFITIISQYLDLLLRGYLGLITDHNNFGEKKVRYYKYVFPAYLLKDEEKIHCNDNGQREWVVKCSHNSQPPPLIFKHSFISISLTKISSTFFSVSNFSSNDDSEQSELNNNLEEDSPESQSNNVSSQAISCMICYENPSNVVFSPCLHSGICDNCIDELMKWTVCKLKKSPCCHFCRSPIEIAWQLDPKESHSNNKTNYFSERCTEVIYPKLLPYDYCSNEKNNIT